MNILAVVHLSQTCPLFLGAYGVVLKCRHKVRSDEFTCNHLILLSLVGLVKPFQSSVVLVILCISIRYIFHMKTLCSTKRYVKVLKDGSVDILLFFPYRKQIQ